MAFQLLIVDARNADSDLHHFLAFLLLLFAHYSRSQLADPWPQYPTTTQDPRAVIDARSRASTHVMVYRLRAGVG
jgi:hypothetical protein